jgi:hypothetical protein
VVCVALLPLGYLTRAYTVHPLLTRVLPWFVARVSPLELQLGGIQGDWRTNLTLRDVVLVEHGDTRTVERLALERVTLRGQLARLVRGRLTALREVELEGLEGSLDLRSTPGGKFEAPWISLLDVPGISLVRGQLALRTDAGVITLTELVCSGDAAEPRTLSGAVAFDGLDGRAKLVLTPHDAGRQVDAKGSLTIPSWIELGIKGSLDGRSGTLHGARLDLRGTGALDRALDGSGGVAALDERLRWFEGEGSAEITLQGLLAALELSGRVTVNDGRVRAEGVPSLDAVELEIALSPTRVEIVEARCTIGAAPVNASGTFDFGGGAPTMKLRVFGENVLLARSSEARVRANIELAAEGSLTAPDIGGEIALVGSRVRLDVDLLGALQGALPRRGSGPKRARGAGLELPAVGPSGSRVDIALVTREPVRVLGNIARGELRADLRLTGDAAAPVLTGQVFVDPLEIALPAATVKFESGAVRFSADRPNVAQLELVGETRLAGYDVQADLKGTYEEPELQLSSTPPLSADQLVLLLVSGRPPAESGQLTAAGESLAVFVAKDLVRSWFDDGGFDDRKSFLNRIEVVTGRDVSKSGVLTLEATYLVRERVGGREGGAYGVLERDAYEDYNLGLRFVVRLR